MPKFRLQITEHVHHIFEIEAPSIDEAIIIVDRGGGTELPGDTWETWDILPDWVQEIKDA